MCKKMDKPRIRVDFNESAAQDLVLLAKSDVVEDSEGNKIELSQGKHVSVYEYNHYSDGEKEYLLAEGIAELNDANINGEWTKKAKWCCRINEEGIRVESNKNT